jgi:hypothetical protein
MIRTLSAHLHGTVALALTFGVLLLTTLLGHAWQQDQQKGSMPGMDMRGMGDMSDMGQSMAAMAGHVYSPRCGQSSPATRRKQRPL